MPPKGRAGGWGGGGRGGAVSAWMPRRGGAGSPGRVTAGVDSDGRAGSVGAAGERAEAVASDSGTTVADFIEEPPCSVPPPHSRPDCPSCSPTHTSKSKSRSPGGRAEIRKSWHLDHEGLGSHRGQPDGGGHVGGQFVGHAPRLAGELDEGD